MKNNQSILIVANSFWPEYAGWINQTIKIINNIDDEKIKFFVLTRDILSESTSNFYNNIPIRRVFPSVAYTHIVYRLLFFINVVIYLFKNKQTYDVILFPVAFLPLPFLIPVAHYLNKPVITRVAINELEGGNFFGKLRFYFICLSDVIVCLNEKTKELLISKKTQTNIVFIPNGVESQYISETLKINCTKELKAKHNIPAENLVICYVGLINNRKGVDVLIRAFERVLTINHKVSLILVGPYSNSSEIDDVFVEKIKRKVISETLVAKIIMTGRVNDVNAYFLASDIFILPSFSEGMPNVLLEAMAHGVPSIGSNIPGIRELIQDGTTGLLFTPDADDDLYNKIVSLLADQQLRERIGKNGLDFVNEKFAIKKTAAEYKKIFESLVT